MTNFPPFFGLKKTRKLGGKTPVKGEGCPKNFNCKVQGTSVCFLHKFDIDIKYNFVFFFLQKANLEIQFPPEIAGAEEFKAGPGDTATLSFKVRAFPGADSSWFLLEPPEEEVT